MKYELDVGAKSLKILIWKILKLKYEKCRKLFLHVWWSIATDIFIILQFLDLDILYSKYLQACAYKAHNRKDQLQNLDMDITRAWSEAIAEIPCSWPVWEHQLASLMSFFTWIQNTSEGN